MFCKIKPRFFYKKNFISYILSLFTIFYLFAYYLKRLKNKLFKKIIYSNKTICIGNIVLGGSGKTQIAIEIAKFLKKKKYNICFISKGYSRKLQKDIAVLMSCGNIYNLEDIGDEAMILSEYSNICIVNKRNAIPFDLNEYQYLIFDDGLQDNSFKANVNIAIFDCNFFIGNGFILPAGPLREPLFKGLKNVDYIILTDFIASRDNNKIDYLSKLINREKIFTSEIIINKEYDKSKQYLAFAGIGENQKFFSTLKKNGFNVISELHFEDHHYYTENDITTIALKAKEYNAQIITTYKDYIKIPKNQLSKHHVEYLDITYTMDYKFLELL